MQPLLTMQGSPSATLVSVEEQVDLLLPSLISGVVSSSMISPLNQDQVLVCKHKDRATAQSHMVSLA